ncbi:MAG: extracellular solute-binding protein [Clostridia bacterium]|nr:extracellular solute-binding protein [Clostridia bacterium]
MEAKRFSRAIAGLLAVVVLLTMAPSFALSAMAEEDISGYTEYRQQYATAVYPQAAVSATADGATVSGATVTEEDGKAVVLLDEQGETATFSVEVPEEGLYHIRVEYLPVQQEKSLMKTEIGLQIDGKSPYTEGDSLLIEQPWADVAEKAGYDMLPEQAVQIAWTTMSLQDPEGYSAEALYFHLTAGVHTVTVTQHKGAWMLHRLEVYNDAPAPTYEELAQQYAANGYTDAPSFSVEIQAEDYLRKSDSTLMPDSDPSDPNTHPNDPTKQYFNYIPGTRYLGAGQWMEWQVEVPADGLYTIDLRVRQSTKNGMVSTRRLLIDGALPFAECDDLQFPYGRNWYLYSFGKEDDPYLFYLEKGVHTIRLEVTPGILIENYVAIYDYISRLNALYRKVVAVTGFSADKYRNYNLRDAIPGIQEEIESLKAGLEEQKASVISHTGKAGEQLSSLQAIINALVVFADDPDKIPLMLNSFKGHIESLSSWNGALNQQPLDVDYIRVYTAGTELAEEQVGFFQSLLFAIRRFLSSFREDYTGTAGNEDAQKELTVWLSSGRDQLRVTKNLVEGDFAPNHNTVVNLSISTDITSAVMAGKGPDVALFQTGDDPVRLGCRNSLLDLSSFEGFDEVAGRFSAQALVPATYKGAVYGLPLTEIFPMMFVRNDVLEEYGLKAPTTWTDMYLAAAVLQRNNIDIGIPSTTGMFFTLLMQNGGSVFDENYMAAFDQQASIDGFQTWTDFYKKYSFPLTFDFFNRFRSGEMAIGITDYTMYAQLQASAPEIKGKWSMLPLPSVVGEDGTMNSSVSICGATGITVTSGLSQTITYGVIFDAVKDPQTAWDFLAWFTEADTQTQFGYDIEAQMGPAGRYAAANLEALGRLPWEEDELAQLYAAVDNVVAVQELPGTYYIAREINNAFRAVLYNGAYPVDTLCQHNTVINTELLRKYKQFDIG